MKYEVIKEFRDKNTKEIYVVGASYDTDAKTRANELIKSGYLKGDEKQDAKAGD